ncbi:MAG: hypothetical protein EBR82_54635 [Caulobacteraceae bacterium]|nr:hypothetical protein [Caulobacteraceae bacterium]
MLFGYNQADAAFLIMDAVFQALIEFLLFLPIQEPEYLLLCEQSLQSEFQAILQDQPLRLQAPEPHRQQTRQQVFL